jgi:hypothetical protein
LDAPRSMTLKQYAEFRFFRLVEAYQDAKTRLDTDEGKRDFIVLSVQLHAAKADVPKSYWRYAK